jgi:predicted GNAT family acetyltransferase
MSVTVADAPERRRYEATLDGSLVGFAAYVLRDDVVIFIHTEVDELAEGQGIGSVIARSALDDVRARGAKVVARCPFIAAWIKRHPDYADLLADSARTG